MASPHMLDFLLSLPMCTSLFTLTVHPHSISPISVSFPPLLAVYAFNQPIKSRQLLYSSPAPSPSSPPYSVLCTPATSSRGPAYLVSFSCPSYPSGARGGAKIEVFTVEIRKDYWGRLPPDDWLSLVVDGAQRCQSFEYP